MKYDWSKERIESVIVDCDSLSQVLEKLNIPRAGNNTATLRKKLEEYNIDYSHFTYGAKSKKGIENYVPVKEYLGTGKYIHTTKLKEKLIKEGLKKNECENPKCPCKNGYWLDNPLISYTILTAIIETTDQRIYKCYAQIVIHKQITIVDKQTKLQNIFVNYVEQKRKQKLLDIVLNVLLKWHKKQTYQLNRIL